MDLRAPRLLGELLKDNDFDRSFVVTRTRGGEQRPDELTYMAG